MGLRHARVTLESPNGRHRVTFGVTLIRTMSGSEASLIGAIATMRTEGIPMLIDFPNRGSQPDDGLDGQTRPDLITVPEAALMIGLHTDTLYRLCRTGQFDPAIQIGARWRVSVPRLERYLHGDAAGE
jgi:predicted DNA-binding transcriptional regulator AlpA